MLGSHTRATVWNGCALQRGSCAAADVVANRWTRPREALRHDIQSSSRGIWRRRGGDRWSDQWAIAWCGALRLVLTGVGDSTGMLLTFRQLGAALIAARRS
jgi:hypothetical protein